MPISPAITTNLDQVVTSMGTFATLELLTGNPTPPTPALKSVLTEVPDAAPATGYPFAVIWHEGTGDVYWDTEQRGTIGGGPARVGTDMRVHRVHVGVFVGTANDKLQDLEKQTRQWPDLIINAFRAHQQLGGIVSKVNPVSYEYTTLELSDDIHFGVAVKYEVTVRYSTKIAQ